MTAIPTVKERLRLLAVCSVLTGLVFLQEPGLVVTDTKLDLTVDPVGWLGRALHLWEPHGWLGQVQNQAYGYLFPMGPFFALGHGLGIPGWVVQRLWASMLVCVAVVGVTKLADRLGIGTSGSRLAAGVLFAMSPRFLTTLGPISAETLPMALAPWIVLPLVTGTMRGQVRVSAARSGLAVFACGAVNAVATLAVLPLPALYLLTRERGRLRWRFLLGWSCSRAGGVPLVGGSAGAPRIGQPSVPRLDRERSGHDLAHLFGGDTARDLALGGVLSGQRTGRSGGAAGSWSRLRSSSWTRC